MRNQDAPTPPDLQNVLQTLGEKLSSEEAKVRNGRDGIIRVFYNKIKGKFFPTCFFLS